MKEKIFFQVFICTVTLTILSLAVAVVLLLIDTPNPQETKSLIETCSTTWKMGFAAILGLIGGKALN
ncbi:MAG: hypothetical protein MI799_08940 [Desulfobacterales bacterium]|nr:hypothetical protein [Desulfobacterales bacterium]